MNDTPERIWIPKELIEVYSLEKGSSCGFAKQILDGYEYILKSVADKDKLTAQEHRETRILTETLRNQLIKDGLLDGEISNMEIRRDATKHIRAVWEELKNNKAPALELVDTDYKKALAMTFEMFGKCIDAIEADLKDKEANN